jgi:antitoxin HicB
MPHDAKTILAKGKLAYPALIYPDPDGGFVAEIPELKGCIAQGETVEECLQELESVLDLWLLSSSGSVPKPDTERFVERIRTAVS